MTDRFDLFELIEGLRWEEYRMVLGGTCMRFTAIRQLKILQAGESAEEIRDPVIIVIETPANFVVAL